jgi:MFS family permease
MTKKSGSELTIFRPLAPQCLVAAFQFFGLGVFIAFLPLLATQVVGITATQVGILFTIGGIVAIVLGIPMGILADHIGKKTCMILGIIVSIIALTAMAFIESYPWLIFLVSLRSLGMAMFNPSALALLSDSVPVQHQSTVMGIYGGFCENIGIIAGSALGGFLWTTWGHQGTFLAAAAAAVVGIAICVFLVKTRGNQNMVHRNDCDC